MTQKMDLLCGQRPDSAYTGQCAKVSSVNAHLAIEETKYQGHKDALQANSSKGRALSVHT